MSRGPTELALESNAVAEAVDSGERRAVRRLLVMDRRFRSRSKLEAVELALETASNMLAVHMTDQAAGAEAIRLVQRVIDCLHDDE